MPILCYHKLHPYCTFETDVLSPLHHTHAKTAKAILHLINNLIEDHSPPRAIVPPYRVHKARNVDSPEILQPKVFSSNNAARGIIPAKSEDGGSCDRRARCKKKNIRNPAD